MRFRASARLSTLPGARRDRAVRRQARCLSRLSTRQVRALVRRTHARASGTLTSALAWALTPIRVNNRVVLTSFAAARQAEVAALRADAPQVAIRLAEDALERAEKSGA